MEEFGYFIGVIVWCVIWGFVTKSINENKGYEGGFLWGFFLGIIGVIVVACKSECRTESPALSNRDREEDILSRGGWRCRKCYRVNSSYMTTCVCGFSAEANRKKELEEKKRELAMVNSDNNVPVSADELAKYKKLFDDGAITEEEYNDIKKKLLKL